ERLRRHGRAEPGGAGDRGGLGDPMTELRRVEAEEAPLLAKARHGHEDELALTQCSEPHGALGRVGIALETRRGLPLGSLGAPSPAARRAWMSLRSSRSGDALISTALLCARAASNTASRSTSYGSRAPSKRPVGWARMLTYGFASARTMRAVISSRACLKREWTATRTRSSSLKVSSGKSSVPSPRTSHSLPARIRIR